MGYGPVGRTRPAEEIWTAHPPGFRRYERTVVIGHGAADWDAASRAVLDWAVKRRSGFRVTPPEPVTFGARYRVTAAVGPFAVHEPVRVVAVVDTASRRGFAYGTEPGHPVSGEEAFVVHRTSDGTIRFTLRSLTRAAPALPWRAAFPILLIAQRYYRRRYLAALVSARNP
ncbi:DUF1990 family protein [Nocardia sp. NPDC127579]|uniref:DUF1990 family protein n=1 Tax=Nocardia sp. NPDC127579 TaxID=3345402 RepID=UPI003633D111